MPSFWFLFPFYLLSFSLISITLFSYTYFIFYIWMFATSFSFNLIHAWLYMRWITIDLCLTTHKRNSIDSDKYVSSSANNTNMSIESHTGNIMTLKQLSFVSSTFFLFLFLFCALRLFWTLTLIEYQWINYIDRKSTAFMPKTISFGNCLLAYIIAWIEGARGLWKNKFFFLIFDLLQPFSYCHTWNGVSVDNLIEINHFFVVAVV